jgi:hypothetical protein
LSAEWRSNLGAFEGATERAIQAGLIAAAELYTGEMREQLQQGFTSGNFVTGNLANSVQRGDVKKEADGYEVPVGSTQTDPPYGLYWELGFHSIFSGKHERQERWVPTMVRMRDQLVAAVSEEIRAVDGAL